MNTQSAKSTGPQIDVAIEIERETTRLKELAHKADLLFLSYLIGMAHQEAAVIAKGRSDAAERSATLTQKS